MHNDVQTQLPGHTKTSAPTRLLLCLVVCVRACLIDAIRKQVQFSGAVLVCFVDAVVISVSHIQQGVWERAEEVGRLHRRPNVFGLYSSIREKASESV